MSGKSWSRSAGIRSEGATFSTIYWEYSSAVNGVKQLTRALTQAMCPKINIHTTLLTYESLEMII